MFRISLIRKRRTVMTSPRYNKCRIVSSSKGDKKIDRTK
jgi:hypothetical protein